MECSTCAAHPSSQLDMPRDAGKACACTHACTCTTRHATPASRQRKEWLRHDAATMCSDRRSAAGGMMPCQLQLMSEPNLNMPTPLPVSPSRLTHRTSDISSGSAASSLLAAFAMQPIMSSHEPPRPAHRGWPRGLGRHDSSGSSIA